jgi:hypothetical protein
MNLPFLKVKRVPKMKAEADGINNANNGKIWVDFMLDGIFF